MEANAELLALQRLDETCTHLQKQGNYLEALECMERGLVLRQHFFGSESDEVRFLSMPCYYSVKVLALINIPYYCRSGMLVKLLVNCATCLQ